MAKKKTNFGNKKEEVIVDLNNEPVSENKVETEEAVYEPIADNKVETEDVTNEPSVDNKSELVDLNNEPVSENKVETEGVTNGATNEPVAKKTYQEMMGYTFSDYGYFN